MVALEDICVAIVDCEHKTAPKALQGHPSVRTTDIRNGRIDFEGAGRVSEETYAAWTRRRRPCPGDLILAREAPVGEVGLIPEGVYPVLGQRTVLISPDRGKVVPQYLHYLLLSPPLRHELETRSSGSTVPHLNMADIRALELPQLPTLRVQARLARALGALDDNIENNRKMAATLEEMARALYRSWFVDFDPVHAKAAGEKPAFMDEQTAALFPDRFGDDGLPEGWRMAPLSDVMSFKGGTQPPAKDFMREPMPGYVRLLQIRDFKSDAHATYVPFTNRMRTVSSDDICIGRYGSGSGDTKDSLGRLCRGLEGAINVALVKVEPKGNFREYLATYIGSGYFRRDISGGSARAVQAGFRQADLDMMEVVIGGHEIHAEFECIGELVWNRIKAWRAESQNLESLRDTLLPKLMSGEIRVGEAREQVEELT